MRLSRTGYPWFTVTLISIVDRTIFANALADHHWTYSLQFNPEMSRKEAILILETQLRLKGTEGIEKHAWEGASVEFAQPYEDAYDAAIKWITKKYPPIKCLKILRSASRCRNLLNKMI